jgi:putative zinc finger/helix-turn-helix YgiT family protein
MKAKIICPNCGSKNIEKRTEDYLYKESGLDNLILGGITVYKCEDCNEIMPEIPRIEDLHKVIALRIIGTNEPLTGKEIRFLRKDMGLSSVELAKQFGVSKVTVSRWENDAEKIGPANDKLIRLRYCLNHLKGLRESGKREPDKEQLNRWTDDLMAQEEAIFAAFKEERQKGKPRKIFIRSEDIRKGIISGIGH